MTERHESFAVASVADRFLMVDCCPGWGRQGKPDPGGAIPVSGSASSGIAQINTANLTDDESVSVQILFCSHPKELYLNHISLPKWTESLRYLPSWWDNSLSLDRSGD